MLRLRHSRTFSLSFRTPEHHAGLRIRPQFLIAFGQARLPLYSEFADQAPGAPNTVPYRSYPGNPSKVTSFKKPLSTRSYGAILALADAAALALLSFDIHAELKFKEFEMFEAGSQDFCSAAGLDKRLGFIDFCAVQ